MPRFSQDVSEQKFINLRNQRNLWTRKLRAATVCGATRDAQIASGGIVRTGSCPQITQIAQIVLEQLQNSFSLLLLRNRQIEDTVY